jgi:hypothetical protein
MDKIWFKKELKMDIKNFNDLNFIEHPSTFGGVYCKMMFENGYGILVYDGKLDKYEVEILDSDGEPTYKTGISNDSISGVSSTEISELMEKIQKL